jgi:hypothetical protein
MYSGFAFSSKAAVVDIEQQGGFAGNTSVAVDIATGQIDADCPGGTIAVDVLL